MRFQAEVNVELSRKRGVGARGNNKDISLFDSLDNFKALFVRVKGLKSEDIDKAGIEGLLAEMIKLIYESSRHIKIICVSEIYKSIRQGKRSDFPQAPQMCRLVNSFITLFICLDNYHRTLLMFSQITGLLIVEDAEQQGIEANRESADESLSITSVNNISLIHLDSLDKDISSMQDVMSESPVLEETVGQLYVVLSDQIGELKHDLEQGEVDKEDINNRAFEIIFWVSTLVSHHYGHKYYDGKGGQSMDYQGLFIDILESTDRILKRCWDENECLCFL